MITLHDIETAREQIAPYVRRTPVLHAPPLREKPFLGDLWLKLESLQVSGSFKARGAMNKLRSLSPTQLERGIITASGGNHGVAVAYAGYTAHIPTEVYLPRTVPPVKIEKLKRWGASVVLEGDVFDDAQRAALEVAEAEGATYIHPFADPVIIAGQGTIGLEILDDLPNVDTVIIAIGGGGLIAGVALAIKQIKPSVRIIGVEPTGAPTLKESLRAGELITLPGISTKAGTLAPRRTAQINLDLIRDHVDDIVLVTDDEMASAAHWLWFEAGIGAELSGAASMAALLQGKFTTRTDETICVLVCGAGADGIAP